MSDSADHIRRQMRNIRREMGSEVSEVVVSAQQLTDWRYYLRTYPWLCVGAAAALGVLAAPRRRSPAQEEANRIIGELRRLGLPDLAQKANRGGVMSSDSLFGRLVAMAAPFAMRAATNFVAQRMGEQHATERHEDSFENMRNPR